MMKKVLVLFVAAVLVCGAMAVEVLEEPFRRPGGGGSNRPGGGGGGGGGGGNRPEPPAEDSIEVEENPCKGLLVGILEHPSSCFKYITCYKEVATEEICPPDTIFDKEEITCVPGNQRTCRKEGDEIPLPGDMCRGIILGTMVHPEDCGKYVSCLLGRARERSCRRGFVFSERLFVCLPGDLNSCTVTLLPTTTTIAPEDVRPLPSDICRRNNMAFGLLPHPQFCTRYVTCTLWIPGERECDRFKVFSERFSMCMYGNVNSCRPILGRTDSSDLGSIGLNPAAKHHRPPFTFAFVRWLPMAEKKTHQTQHKPFSRIVQWGR
uniref:Chitin-binding type-2 domain-containing protein n=1 Tax=Anopheles farauti TaxID=69004 RepID=A0A182QTZ8_9DIPT